MGPVVWFDALAGDGLQVTSGGTGGVTAHIGEGPSGTTVNLDGLIRSNPSYQGSITIGGTTLSIPGFAGPVWANHLAFATVPFMLPNVADGPVLVTTPFTMQGSLAAFASSSPGAPQVFSLDVTGSGIASAGLTSSTLSDGTRVLLHRSGANVYTFAAEASPTPERPGRS